MEPKRPRRVRVVHVNVLKSPLRSTRSPTNAFRGFARNKHAQVFVIASLGSGQVQVNGKEVGGPEDEGHDRYVGLLAQEHMKKYDWKIRTYAKNPIAEICALRQAIGRCLLSMVPQSPPKTPRWGGKRASPVKRRFPSMRYTPRNNWSSGYPKERTDIDFHLNFDESPDDTQVEKIDELSDRMNAIHLWYKTQLLQEQLQSGAKRCSKNMVKTNVNGRMKDQNGNLID
ncbi:unnamed protein product [Bursaphelenchus xylophilus]|uniref:(pine wood nematode) hypothetical protein n=1 Tax=Bursaphelenchus xylophilus TaxID=6326 RepID=A0A1I7RS43_BURXY|nr:unnamed protein product [Bursaphelenchus xylophilus]CAG9123238.1 unnamed protein product [Bursaphelenchus xylophilus]